MANVILRSVMAPTAVEIGWCHDFVNDNRGLCMCFVLSESVRFWTSQKPSKPKPTRGTTSVYPSGLLRAFRSISLHISTVQVEIMVRT